MLKCMNYGFVVAHHISRSVIAHKDREPLLKKLRCRIVWPVDENAMTLVIELCIGKVWMVN